jgi:hypothetical protein
MTEKIVTWKMLREDTAKIADKREEVLKRTKWSPVKLDEEIEYVRELLNVQDSTAGLNGLTEIVCMREFVVISDELPKDLQLALMHVMWLFEWTVDETKRAISGASARFGLEQGGIANSITTLREIGVKYRQLKDRRIWPDNTCRIRCAELVWLLQWDERTVHQEMCKTRDRFHYQRGVEAKVLDGMRELELLYRSAPFRGKMPEAEARFLTEVMWLRGWNAEKALHEATQITNELSLRNERETIHTLHEICMLCGGKERPNTMTDAVKTMWDGYPPDEGTADHTMSRLAEYMWLQGITLEQTMTKVGRFARVNAASPAETLEVLIDIVLKQRKESQQPH